MFLLSKGWERGSKASVWYTEIPPTPPPPTEEKKDQKPEQNVYFVKGRHLLGCVFCKGQQGDGACGNSCAAGRLGHRWWDREGGDVWGLGLQEESSGGDGTEIDLKKKKESLRSLEKEWWGGSPGKGQVWEKALKATGLAGRYRGARHMCLLQSCRRQSQRQRSRPWMPRQTVWT